MDEKRRELIDNILNKLENPASVSTVKNIYNLSGLVESAAYLKSLETAETQEHFETVKLFFKTYLEKAALT